MLLGQCLMRVFKRSNNVGPTSTRSGLWDRFRLKPSRFIVKLCANAHARIKQCWMKRANDPTMLWYGPMTTKTKEMLDDVGWRFWPESKPTKHHPTSSNMFDEGVQTIQQCWSNNVGWCWSNNVGSFAQGLKEFYSGFHSTFPKIFWTSFRSYELRWRTSEVHNELRYEFPKFTANFLKFISKFEIWSSKIGLNRFKKN